MAAHMTTHVRVKSLQEKHAVLEKQINHEQNRVRPDSAMLRGLKRYKLRIKDKLHTLLARRHKPLSINMAIGCAQY